MIKVGLTGSIAMGKSTVAEMFRRRGVPVYDADAAIHRAYGPGGAALDVVGALAPEAVSAQGVDRKALKKRTIEDSSFLSKLEAAVHPIIAEDRRAFLRDAEAEGAAFAVLDIPLLFETGLDRAVDLSIVVSAPAEIQRARALERQGMTEEMLATILARQTPDAEKRARADIVINTGGSLESTEAQVDAICAELVSKRQG